MRYYQITIGDDGVVSVSHQLVPIIGVYILARDTEDALRRANEFVDMIVDRVRASLEEGP